MAKCGVVTEQERDEIQKLHQRKLALTELLHALGKIADPVVFERLYTRMVNDLGATIAAYDVWWRDKAVQYNWPNVPGATWRVDFKTGSVSLETGD